MTLRVWSRPWRGWARVAPVVVTFLSDFGLQDDFVGTCHGVIKRIAPDVEIIDITHGIQPQAVMQGALVPPEHPPVHARGRPPRGRRPRRWRSTSAVGHP